MCDVVAEAVAAAAGIAAVCAILEDSLEAVGKLCEAVDKFWGAVVDDINADVDMRDEEELMPMLSVMKVTTLETKLIPRLGKG